MNASPLDIDPFFNLLCQLCNAHEIDRPESPDEIREFSFTPGGASYRLLPHPQVDTLALLEIDIKSLDPQLDSTAASPAVERFLRMLLQLNATFQDQSQWLISLDDEDVLVLSIPVPLVWSSIEALQMIALEGLQRAHALREF